MKDISIDTYVSRETKEKLNRYKDILFKWQRAVNLVSRETLPSFWNRHVLDSLQLIPYIKEGTVLDVGSGGGFPGVVISICSEIRVTCVDSDNKKTIFLEEVARELKLNTTIINSRIEDISNKNYDTICARGFSSLSNLISITNSHSTSKYGVFLKGKNYMSEIEEAKKAFDFRYDIFKSKADSNGKIITVSDISKK